MKAKLIPATAGALFVALLVMLAPSASGARGVQYSITASKKADGNYKNFANLDLKKGEKKFVYFHATNNSTSAQTLTLTDGFTTNPNPDGYKILWFDGFEGKVRITIDVKGAGYGVELDPGETRDFRARIFHKSKGSPFCADARLGDGSTSSDAYVFVNTDLCQL